MINRSGQVGRILTSVPVMMLIFLLIGLFLVLTSFVGNAWSFVSYDLNSNILLKVVEFKGQNITFIEAFASYPKGSTEADYAELINKLKKVLEKEDSGGCFFMAPNLAITFGDVIGQKEVRPISLDLYRPYINRVLVDHKEGSVSVKLTNIHTSFSTDSVLFYYYGPCLEEKK